MSTVVFIGPTWQGFSIDESIKVLPPAQQGDIAGVTVDGVETIILIDGYFTQHLAPWHKEIVLALERGVRVIGAASLGALRAVECERYGMEPVGEIAKWYKDGTCIDDADVALIHADETQGCWPMSVPLVNIRATAMKLLSLGLIGDVNEMVRQFSEIHYTDRSWKCLEMKSPKMASLLKSEYVDQKAEDAKLAIYQSFQPFNQTNTRDVPKNIMNDYMVGLLKNDIRFQGKKRPWEIASKNNAGIDSWLLSEMAFALGIRADEEQIKTATILAWKNLGIESKAQAENWLSNSGISNDEFNEFATREAVKQNARDWFNSISRGRDFVPITCKHELLTKYQKNVSF